MLSFSFSQFKQLLKFELNAFVYIKKINMISFSLFIKMLHISYDIKVEGDKNLLQLKAIYFLLLVSNKTWTKCIGFWARLL